MVPELTDPVALDAERLTILAGAGVSLDRPSCVPAGAAIIDVLVDWICRDHPAERHLLDQLRAPARDQSPYRGPLGSLRFELLLGECTRWKPAVLRALSVLESRGGPNLWHLRVIDAVRHGARVLTTNFDTRLEAAAALLDVDLPVVTVGTRVPPVRALASAALIKLHGSFPSPGRRALPTGTLAQMAGFGLAYERAPALRRQIDTWLGDRDLLILGYSGSDTYDVVPLLVGAAAARRVVVQRWSPKPGVTFRAPRRVDLLVSTDLTVEPLDVFAADLAARHPKVVVAEGGVGALMDACLPSLSAVVPAAGPEDPSASAQVNEHLFRGTLARPELRLAHGAGTLLADSLREVYLQEGPLATRGVEPPWLARMPNDLAVKLRTAGVDRHRPVVNERTSDLVDLGTRLLKSHRLGRPRLDLYAGREVVADLEFVLWRTVDEQPGQAFKVLALLRAACREARLLDELVRADFLEASILLAKVSRPRNARSGSYLARALPLLNTAAQRAARIPRVDLVVECERLRGVYDRDARDRVCHVLATWGPRQAPGAGRQLAALDRLWWTVDRPAAADGSVLIELATELSMTGATNAGDTCVRTEDYERVFPLLAAWLLSPPEQRRLRTDSVVTVANTCPGSVRDRVLFVMALLEDGQAPENA